MMALAPYAPMQNKKQDVYLAPTFNVMHDIAKPTMASIIDAEICQVRSLKRPDE